MNRRTVSSRNSNGHYICGVLDEGIDEYVDTTVGSFRMAGGGYICSLDKGHLGPVHEAYNDHEIDDEFKFCCSWNRFEEEFANSYGEDVFLV